MHGPQTLTARTGLAISHSITVHGKKTSVSLEDEFWQTLQELARNEYVSVRTLIEQIDANRKTSNLSSAIRIFILRRLWQMAGKGPL